METANWNDGAATGDPAIKKNLEALRSSPGYNDATKKIVGALMAQPKFRSYAWPKQVMLAINRYDPGMFYGNHMDAPIMGMEGGQAMRSDLSFTLALTDPDDYRGGEFVIQTPFGEERLKLEAGAAIVYPSTMIHRVDPIEDGTRWAAFGWIQSMMRDDSRREILYEINQLRGIATREIAGTDIVERFDHLHSNLLRLWAEV
jgi:PKHD-type hydroxylase